MTIRITETTRTDRAAFGSRLQSAREASNFSRRQVAELTGIPVKSIEKFETGDMSPSIDRVQALARVIDVSPTFLLNGAPTKQEVEEIGAAVAKHHEYLDDIDAILDAFLSLDEMRKNGFQRHWRTAPRSFEALEEIVGKMSYDELLDVGEARGLLAVPQSEVEMYEGLPLDEQIVAKQALADRIVDTAYFGIDLFSLDPEPLSDLADEFDVEKDQEGILFSSWSGDSAMIVALRPVLKERFLKGNQLDFEDEEQFPKREGA